MLRPLTLITVLSLLVPTVVANHSFASQSDTCRALFDPVVLPVCPSSVAHEGWVAPTAACYDDPVDAFLIRFSLLYCEIRVVVTAFGTGDPNPYDDDRRLSVGAVYSLTHSIAPAADAAMQFVEIACETSGNAPTLHCNFDGVLPLYAEFFGNGCTTFTIESSMISRGITVNAADAFRVCVDDIEDPTSATVVRA